MNAIKLGSIIYKELSKNPALYSLIGDKISPLIAQHETTFPFIVYKRNGIKFQKTKDGYTNNVDVNYTFIIASDNYDDGVDVACAFCDNVDSLIGNYESIIIKDIDIEDDSIKEEYSDDTYLQIINLNFKLK